MVSSPIKCTPKESPMTKAIINSHRSPLAVFISFSHRKPIQKSEDRIKVAMAYTSVSTALNQKLSEKQKANAPTAALPKKPILSVTFSRFLKFGSFCKRSVRVQNRKSMVNAEEKTDIKLTIKATC